MSPLNTDAGMPIKLTLDPGTYQRCTCGRSRNLPFCDESHHGSGQLPLEFTLSKRQTVYLCSCGQTETAPFCDGRCGFTPPHE